MCPTIATAARDRMRPFLALYIGGMGSRKQNFYNQLVQRYGFEDAARQVQDLYLEGKKDEAAAALPDELIDLITLCGPKEHVRDRLAAFREAGVGTLTIGPTALTTEERIEQLRAVAELVGLTPFRIGCASSWARSGSRGTPSRCSRSGRGWPSAGTR